jgi:hypothetical protein
MVAKASESLPAPASHPTGFKLSVARCYDRSREIQRSLNAILKNLYYSSPGLLIGIILRIFNGLLVALQNMAAFILKPIF